MRFLKRAGIVCGNILLVGSLLLAAFFVPEWFVKMKDESSLGQEKAIKLEMNTYELTYHNFAEKLYLIANYETMGIVMQAVQVPDNEVTDEELTEYVVQEIDALLEPVLDISLSVKPEELMEREQYMLYGNMPGETSNAFAGIYFYKLTYVIEGFGYDNFELVFLLDSEFHKLYGFSMNTLKSNTIPPESNKLNTRLISAEDQGLDAALPLDKLIDYWELEENYHLEVVKDEKDQFWKEKKFAWGRYAGDYLCVSDRGTVYGINYPLAISRYLLYTEYNSFVIKMGLLLLDEYTSSTVEYVTDSQSIG